jgi:hypothetical protein
MNLRPKRVPRLWCAMQGLLPLDSCLAAERAELAWPSDSLARESPAMPQKKRNRIAASAESLKLQRRGPLRNQS